MSKEMEITFAYSPCPNDTFAFHAVSKGIVTPEGITIKTYLADVEELNQRALKGDFELTKLSFHALGKVLDRYALLRAGSALGRGCGPLLVSRPGDHTLDLGEALVAVPGELTTAHLLLSLLIGRPPRVKPMEFSRIMDAVAAGEADAGLVIHEGRFTFQRHGLVALLDLGDWWESETGLPIPLGCIAVRRDLGAENAELINAALKAGVERSFALRAEPREYVLAHAQEMEDEVVRAHIGLYVNGFTRDLGDLGIKAVGEMLERGRRAGLLPQSRAPLFLEA